MYKKTVHSICSPPSTCGAQGPNMGDFPAISPMTIWQTSRDDFTHSLNVVHFPKRPFFDVIRHSLNEGNHIQVKRKNATKTKWELPELFAYNIDGMHFSFLLIITKVFFFSLSEQQWSDTWERAQGDRVVGKPLDENDIEPNFRLKQKVV